MRFTYRIKLDTNGSFPEKLEALAEQGLLDYVAMALGGYAAEQLVMGQAILGLCGAADDIVALDEVAGVEAEGQAEAIKRVADAQKYEIDTVYNAIHQGNPTNDLLAIKYMETLGKVADGKASKIFLPLETSGITASLGGIAELFKDKKDNNTQK